METCMYSKILPDYSDLDNDSNKRPGYKVYVVENDGGISIQMQDASAKSENDTLKAVFMNVKEAKDFVEGINEAINRATSKNANHKSRAKEI